MTVDRSRGVGRHASSPTANRIKKDEIPPGGLDTLTPGREAGSDNSAERDLAEDEGNMDQSVL